MLGNNKCVFDDNAPDSRANYQKLRVRTKSGIINMKKKSMMDCLEIIPKTALLKTVQNSPYVCEKVEADEIMGLSPIIPKKAISKENT